MMTISRGQSTSDILTMQPASQLSYRGPQVSATLKSWRKEFPEFHALLRHELLA
jgi:hypothetical protein